MKTNNEITNTIAVLGLVLAILALIISSLAPFIGAFSGLIVAAFVAGGLTALWAYRRLRNRD